MNHEKEPYSFPWQWDTEAYLVIATDYGRIELRPSNTELYLFPEDPEIDHIYIMKQQNPDGTSMGYRLFREHCDRLGEGAFSALVEQLIDNGFEIADDEDPSDMDIEAWETLFQREYEPPNSIEKLVKLAMDNFEQKSEYYLGHEWT